jgi:hypothetical protein
LLFCFIPSHSLSLSLSSSACLLLPLPSHPTHRLYTHQLQPVHYYNMLPSRHWVLATVAVVFVALASMTPVARGSSNNVCVFQANQWTSFDSVMQCFYSIPVNNDVKSQTVDALQKALQLYTFLDISNDSPEPRLPVHVNMTEALSYILKWPHKFDYNFHDDVRALFLLLGDAHTQYYAPTCYTSFTAQQPFAPISDTDNSTNQQIISISNYFSTALVQYYLDTMGIDVRQFAGAQIVSIDGFAALPYMIEYANTSVGMSKDLGSRFNYALTRPNPRPDIVQGMRCSSMCLVRSHVL